MATEWLYLIAASTLTASAAAALNLILRRALRQRLGARVAYALWALVPLAALMPLLPRPTVTIVVQAPAQAHATMSAAPAAAQLAARGDVGMWIFAAWLAGSVGAIVLCIAQQRRFVRALGHLAAIDAHTLRAQHSDGCPALVGALRPRIVLPADFELRYDARERQLIIAHEATHRRRGDAQANALAALVRCVFWFNPLFHFAASRFRFDQELACDAAVIARFPQERRRYADAMLKTQLAVLGLPAGCHWQSSHPLKERIAMLKHPLPGRTRTLAGVAIAAGLIGAGSLCAWAAQPANVIAKSPATIRGDIALRIDGGAEHRLTILTPPGVEFAVADGDDDNRWELRGTALPHDNGTIELRGVVRHGDTIVSSPLLIASEGISAGLRVDDPNANAAHLDASVVLSRTVSSAPPAPAGERPTENTSFRSMNPPQYPRAAIDAHQTGRVVLRVHVDERGNPQSAQLAEAEPAEAGPVFSSASIAAAMQWRYNPGTIDGKPAAGDVAVPIDFELSDDDG